MSNAANDRDDVSHGTSLLPRDLTSEQLADASALASADALLIDDLTDVEDDTFAAEIRP